MISRTMPNRTMKIVPRLRPMGAVRPLARSLPRQGLAAPIRSGTRVSDDVLEPQRQGEEDAKLAQAHDCCGDVAITERLDGEQIEVEHRYLATSVLRRSTATKMVNAANPITKATATGDTDHGHYQLPTVRGLGWRTSRTSGPRSDRRRCHRNRWPTTLRQPVGAALPGRVFGLRHE